jgi:hypothetical protein
MYLFRAHARPRGFSGGLASLNYAAIRNVNTCPTDVYQVIRAGEEMPTRGWFASSREQLSDCDRVCELLEGSWKKWSSWGYPIQQDRIRLSDRVEEELGIQLLPVKDFYDIRGQLSSREEWDVVYRRIEAESRQALSGCKYPVRFCFEFPQAEVL